jgi:mRNA-degrading endonuclease RelE of RelBE toxin-antitoxin system
MKVEIRTSENFKREARRLLKKFPSLQFELMELQRKLAENPKTGTMIGHNAFKIRLAIHSKGKGKSGGARVISYLEQIVEVETQNLDELVVVNLISIYDKSETATISDKELKALISQVINTGE